MRTNFKESMVALSSEVLISACSELIFDDGGRYVTLVVRPIAGSTSDSGSESVSIGSAATVVVICGVMFDRGTDRWCVPRGCVC